MHTQVSVGILHTLRARYMEVWEREWPHDDQYLRELWLEAQRDLALSPKSRSGRDALYEAVLLQMRTDHDFSKEVN